MRDATEGSGVSQLRAERRALSERSTHTESRHQAPPTVRNWYHSSIAAHPIQVEYRRIKALHTPFPLNFAGSTAKPFISFERRGSVKRQEARIVAAYHIACRAAGAKWRERCVCVGRRECPSFCTQLQLHPLPTTCTKTRGACPIIMTIARSA